MLYIVLIKTANMLFLFITNSSGYPNLVQIGIILDIIFQQLIIISIYPLLCTIKKDDELYSKRKLIEYLFKDIGVLIGGFFIGRIIFGHVIDYNTCLLIAIFFSTIAWIALLFTRKTNQKTTKEEIENKKRNIIEYVKKHKILQIYLLYVIFGNVAMNLGLGLKMLMLTNMFDSYFMVYFNINCL